MKYIRQHLQERNRIAREIHDNVGHLLSRSILIVGAMKIVNEDEKLSSSIEQLEESFEYSHDQCAGERP